MWCLVEGLPIRLHASVPRWLRNNTPAIDGLCTKMGSSGMGIAMPHDRMHWRPNEYNGDCREICGVPQWLRTFGTLDQLELYDLTLLILFKREVKARDSHDFASLDVNWTGPRLSSSTSVIDFSATHPEEASRKCPLVPDPLRRISSTRTFNETYDVPSGSYKSSQTLTWSLYVSLWSVSALVV